jgi:apolipoprotein N-acyltransferase
VHSLVIGLSLAYFETMQTLVGDPVRAITLMLAAILLGASFQAGWLVPLSYGGLVITAVLIEQRYAKFLPAIIAGFIFQLLGVEWTLETYGTLQNTMQRTTNWLLVGLLFAGFMPIVVKVGVLLRDRGWPLWLSLPVAWTIGDFARYESGWLISGSPYPWLTLGLTQTGLTVPCQVADLGGVWAVGFIAAMFSATIAQSIIQRRALIVPILLLVTALIYGQWRISSATFSDGPTIALMPGYSLQVPAVDCAVWPESSFDHYETAPTSALLIQGFHRHDNEKSFNSLAVLKEGELLGCYDKYNLVPWSEFQPWGGPGRQLTAGKRLGIFECRGYRMGTAICYDVCFTDFVRHLSTTQFVVIAANESGDPSMMLAHQLLAATRLRAIEIRRAIVRNANGGFSGIVDGNGRLVAAPQDFREPIIMGCVPIDDRFSIYASCGAWLPIGCFLALVVTVARSSRLQAVPNIRRDAIENETDRPIAH